MPIRILIVDDSALFRRGIRDVLEHVPNWEVCGEAVDGFQAIKESRNLKPHVVVMDFSMPGMTGLEAALKILEECPTLPILLLTLHLTRQLTEEARTTGIKGTLSKAEMNRLGDGIDALLRGEYFTCGEAGSGTCRV